MDGAWARELRILSQRNAHDLERRPLRVLADMQQAGLVTIIRRYVRPGYERHGIEREWALTPRGREATDA